MQLVSCVSTFMFAGHDTTSSALSRTLHCLVLRPDIQQRLREEIDTSGVLKGEVTYDDLMSLPFLDAIVRESLRLSVPLSWRVCFPGWDIADSHIQQSSSD